MRVNMPGRAGRILAVFAGLWVLGVFPGGGGGADATQGGVAGLVFQEKAVSFAGVHPGERVEYVFRFRNEGDSPVRILAVRPT